MKVGDKVQLRRRISQKGGKTRLATEKVTILGIYPHHVQVRNQKGIVRSYINWEWQQLTSKEQLKLDGACNDENCVNCRYYGDCVAGEKGEELALDKAIEIVKRGGLDES